MVTLLIGVVTSTTVVSPLIVVEVVEVFIAVLMLELFMMML